MKTSQRRAVFALLLKAEEQRQKSPKGKRNAQPIWLRSMLIWNSTTPLPTRSPRDYLRYK